LIQRDCGRLVGVRRNENVPTLEEGILDQYVSEALVVLKVFGVEDFAVGLLGGGYDQAVVPA
jgi:hypothetical protein